jgi:ribonuclease P protein component
VLRTGSISELRLRKHADYQRVYAVSRKQFSKGMGYFAALRPEVGADGRPPRGAVAGRPRIGLTVPKAMAPRAVDRNRIKRRMREAIRAVLVGKPGVLELGMDVILHPRKTVMTQPMPELTREVAQVFRAIERGGSPPKRSLDGAPGGGVSGGG